MLGVWPREKDQRETAQQIHPAGPGHDRAVHPSRPACSLYGSVAPRRLFAAAEPVSRKAGARPGAGGGRDDEWGGRQRRRGPSVLASAGAGLTVAAELYSPSAMLTVEPALVVPRGPSGRAQCSGALHEG